MRSWIAAAAVAVVESSRRETFMVSSNGRASGVAETAIGCQLLGGLESIDVRLAVDGLRASGGHAFGVALQADLVYLDDARAAVGLEDQAE